LTSHGAILIEERLSTSSDIRFPKASTVLFGQDYHHRIHTIDLHIAFQEWASSGSIELLFFLTYLDKVSTGKTKGFRAETYITF
jgi:hypothetical protein